MMMSNRAFPNSGVPAEPCDWSAVADSIRRFIACRTRHAQQVEDLAQEVMLRVIDYRARNEVASVHALAYRIAGNVLVDAHRRGGRTDPMPEVEPACDQPSPDRVAYGRQALALLIAALDGMPPLRREVLVRRKLHDQNCARIAQELSLSPKAVEKHITRGLSELSAALGISHADS
jgi:RNA polymerase sigma-70 factor (ECF subfamily)